jgi:hypothetical protein
MIPFSNLQSSDQSSDPVSAQHETLTPDEDFGQGGALVRLAVYDLSHGWAKRLSPCLFCKKIEVAPHTSILIFGKEFFWGGGLQKMSHEDFKKQSGTEPVEIIDMGRTEIPEVEVGVELEVLVYHI